MRCCRGHRISERVKAASVLACCVPAIVWYEFPFPRRHLVAVLVPERGAARPPNAACLLPPFPTPVSGRNLFTLPALLRGSVSVVSFLYPFPLSRIAFLFAYQSGEGRKWHTFLLATTFTHSCHTCCWRRKHRRRLPLHHPNLYFMSTRESERMKEKKKV